MGSFINFIKNIFNPTQTNSRSVSFGKNILQAQTQPIVKDGSHINNKTISQRTIDSYEIEQTWGSKPGEINGKKLKQAIFCSSDDASLQSQNVNNTFDKLFLPSKEEAAINFYCDDSARINKLIFAINESVKKNRNSITLKIDLENGANNNLTIDLKTLKHVLNLIDNNMPVFVKLDERNIKVNPDNDYVKNFYDKATI